MKKRPLVAVLNTVEAAGAQIVEDTTAGYWFVAKTSALLENLLGPFPIGKIKRVEHFSAQAENQQVVLIDAGATKETIVADTRYRIEIGNPKDTYESESTGPAIHAYTSAATLSGVAATDRANVYTALKNKINAYAGNNATAYLTYEFDYTLGGVGANDILSVGDTITQETSGVTAVVGKITVTSGGFETSTGTAAGTIWAYNVSDPSAILDATKTWSYASAASTVTQTDATLVSKGGLAIVDTAGYFISSLGRGGANYVGVTQGFATAVPEITEAPVYAMGVGSVMKTLMPVFDRTNLDVSRGELEYDFQDGMEPDVAKTYTKHVIILEDGDEDAIGAEKEAAEKQVTIYSDDSNGTNDTNFTNALDALS